MKIFLRFSPDITDAPIISETILETGVKININKAQTDGVHGEIWIDVPDTDGTSVIETFRSKGVHAVEMPQSIIIDRDECVDCGACISVCPTGVFNFDEEWSLEEHSDKCIHCSICIPSCPHKALSLPE